MKVAIVINDCGDGSSSLHFYNDIDRAKDLCDSEENYYANEGDPTIIEVPDDFKPPGGFR